MPLPTRLINLPFSQGVDTKTDKKLSSKPEVIENGMFVGGTIQKRPGVMTLTASTDSGGSQSAGQLLFPFGNELVRINGGATYSLGPQSNNWTTKLGSGVICTHKTTRVARNTATQYDFDHAYSNGLIVTAWFEGGSAGRAGLHISVTDAVSGDVYQTGAGIISGTSSGSTARCVALGNVVQVFFRTGANIKVCIVNTLTPETVPSAITLETDAANSTNVLDAIAYPAGGYTIVAYDKAAANIFIIAVNAAGTVLGSPAKTDTKITSALQLRLAIDSNNVGYVVEFQGSYYNTFFPDTFIVGAAATQITPAPDAKFVGALVEASPGKITVFYSGKGLLSTEDLFMATAIIAGSGVVTPFANINGTAGMAIQSDGFLLNGQACCVVTSGVPDGTILQQTSPSIQPTMWVMNSSGLVLAKFFPSSAGCQFGQSTSHVLSMSDGSLAMALSEQGPASYTSVAGTIVRTTPMGITRVNVSEPPDDAVSAVRIGNAVYIGGSLPRLYDGKETVEAGHNWFPESVAVTLGAGGALATGQYQWRVVYYWVSATGELQRSVPCPAATASATAGQKATLTLLTQRITGRDAAGISTTLIEVYRTEANGTLFYSLGSIFGLPANDTTASTISFVDDTVADADLVASPLLYTTGGVNDWVAPPGYAASCEHKTRLIVCLLDDPYAWQSSNASIAGELLRFNESWGGRVPASTGPLVGCASMDGNLFLFTTHAVYLVQGDGPDLLGNNNWPPPQLVTSCDSGAVSAQSIVSTNAGIFFQGSQGFYLLGRGLDCEFIGADVQQFGKYRVRSATLVPTLKQVRYQVDLGSDDAGMMLGGMVTGTGGWCLVYDYYYRQWSVWPNYGAADVCLYLDGYTRVKSTGPVLRENAGTWGDATAEVNTIVETPWIKTADIQGFQRARRMELLGTYASDCTIRVSIAYDYSENFTDVSDFVGNGVLTPGGVLQFRKLLARQKCESIKFRFEDLNISGSGQGMALTGLTLEVGAKGGPYRLPASQST